jgi:hypothetical protein
MFNPFEIIRLKLLEIFTFPGAYELIFVMGKVSRGVMMIGLAWILLLIQSSIVKRLGGRTKAFTAYEAICGAAFVYGLSAPFGLEPSISWRLTIGVSIVATLFLGAFAVVGLVFRQASKEMCGGDVFRLIQLSGYMVGVGFASHTVAHAALLMI